MLTRDCQLPLTSLASSCNLDPGASPDAEQQEWPQYMVITVIPQFSTALVQKSLSFIMKHLMTLKAIWLLKDPFPTLSVSKEGLLPPLGIFSPAPESL